MTANDVIKRGGHKGQWLFICLAFTQALHSTEEYFTELYNRFPAVTGKLNEFTGFIPTINMSGSTFIGLNIVAVLFLFIVSVFLFRKKRWAMRIAFVAAVVETINGVIHVSAAVYTGGYFPGVFSAVGLLIMAILYIRSLGGRTG
jgi:hypothetical protein